MTYDFAAQVEAWSSPPVEGIGYRSSAELLTYTDDQLRVIAEQMWHERYSHGKWRNRGGLWRKYLGLDDTSGMEVLDFGCGAGLEALEYAKSGNAVTVADIVPENVELAARIFGLYGYQAEALPIFDRYPFIDVSRFYDVIHCSGVLHHIPYPAEILARFAEMLRPGGQVRLMVYSDQGWRMATETEPPEDTATHPEFERFVRYFDRVGSYADWYDADKLARLAPMLVLTEWHYITPNDRYAVARLERR